VQDEEERMKIRELKENDKENWIKLAKEADNRDKEWAEKRIKSYTSKKKKKILFVLEENNKLVGFVGLKGEDIEENVPAIFNKDYALVTWIALIPRFRQRGMGSKLLRHCEEYIKKWKKKGIWLGCRDKVISFYIKHGYKKYGTFINENGKEENLVVKELR